MNDEAANIKAARIYLDVCCLQRPFDDQRQVRVHLEAEAVKLILAQVEAGELIWIGSEVIEYEIAQNPDPERALKAMLPLTPELESRLGLTKARERANLSYWDLRALMPYTWRALKAPAPPFS